MATTPNSNPGSNPNQLSEKDLKKLIDLLQKIDKLSEVAATNMANQAQSAGNARQQLDRLEGEWNDITGDISYATKGFKEIQEAIKNTNEGINASVKVYKAFGSIAEDIQRYQRDISQMSEKDVDKLREKVEAQKLNLETANELLEDNRADIEGEQKTLDLLRAQNELAQKNYQTLIDSLKQKEKTHGLSKTETNNLEKFTESLKETKREYTSINNQIKDNNTSLTQIESTLIQNNAALKGFDGLVEGVELTLQRLSKEAKFKNIENLDEKLKSIVKETSSTNENLVRMTKSFGSLTSLAQKAQDHQSGISELSEKEIKNALKQSEIEKKNLLKADEKLKKEQVTLETEQSANKLLVEQTEQQIASLNTQKASGQWDDIKEQSLKDLYELQQKQSKTSDELNTKLEVNKLSQDKILDTITNQNGAYNELRSNLNAISKEVKINLINNIDEGFKNIVEEVQSTDDGINKMNKSFSSITTIAQKIQDHQSGINELSEKDAKVLLEKLESERKRLSREHELFKLEEQRLKIEEQSNKTSLDSTKQEIDNLEAKSSLTKDEEDKLKTFKIQYQELLEKQTKITDNLEVNKAAQEKTSEFINKQNKAYNTTVDSLEKIKKEQENIRKSLGLSGLAVDGIGKAFSKLGLGGLSSAMGLDEAKEKMKEVSKEITNGGEKAAGLVGKFKILGAGLSVIGKNIFSYLTDPLTIVTGLVAGVVASVKGLISLFEESAKYTGDIAKTFGLSADEASRIGDNLRSAAGSDFFMTTEESRKAFDMMANATGVINESFSNSKAVTAMNDLVTYAGYSTEEAEKLYSLSQLNNQSVDDTVSSLQGQLKVLQVNNKLRINEKQAVEMVAKASATVRMNLGANPKKLADAAFYATKLGMTLDEISSAAEQTLNFESAIQNQLEYQVLTGKEINIDAYQQAAASGDAAAASKELNKLIEEQGPNIEKNTFAQEALSKTLGISREQLMKSIQLQKLQKKLGGEQVDIEKAINLKMKEGLSYEEAAAEVGKDGYKSILEQNKNAQVFSRTVAKIKESFMTALSGSEGFKKLFSKENIASYVETIQNDIIPAVTKLAELAGKFIEYLTKPENIQVLKDGFNGLVDTVKSLKEPVKWVIENLGTISKVLLAIAGVKIAANIVKGVGGIVSSIKNVVKGQPGSESNPLYVTPTGGGGGMGLGDMGGGKGKWAKRAGKALKAVGIAAAAYTAYNAFTSKSEGDFKDEEVKAYMEQNPGVTEDQAREQLSKQQYQTGSKTGDIALSAGEAAISYAPDLMNARNATSSVGDTFKNRRQQIADLKSKTPGLTTEDAIKQIRESEKGFFSKLWDGTKNMGTKLADGAKDVGTKLVDGTKNIGTKLVDGAKTVFDGAKSIGTQLLDGTKNLVSQVGTKIGELGTKLVDGVKTLAGKANELLANMVSKVGNLISSLTSKAGDLIKNAASTIANTASKAINAGKSVASAVVDKGKSLASKGVEVAKNVASSGKNMFSKAMDWGSDLLGKGASAVKSVAGKAMDVGKSVVSKTASVAGEALEGAKNVAGKAMSWSKSKIMEPLKPAFKTVGKFLGPIMTAVTSTMDAMSIIDEAKAKQAAGEQIDSGELGKKIVQKAAYPIANLSLNAIPAVGTAASLVDAGLDFLGVSPIRFISDNLIDLLPNDFFSSIGDLAVGKQQQAQQVEDGGLNPNGGPVVSTFQKGELTPVMQGIKEDNVYMTTNKPAQVKDGYYGQASQDNSQVIAAINKLTEAIMSNSSKEITLAMNGQTVGKVLTPIMTPGIVREINNTSVLV